MLLTDAKIRRATPGAAPVRLTDGDGLYLLVQPSGGRWWRFDYRHQGRRKTLSLGTYPEVTLAAARVKRGELRAQVAREEGEQIGRDATPRERPGDISADRWVDIVAMVGEPGEGLVKRPAPLAFAALGEEIDELTPFDGARGAAGRGQRHHGLDSIVETHASSPIRETPAPAGSHASSLPRGGRIRKSEIRARRNMGRRVASRPTI